MNKTKSEIQANQKRIIFCLFLFSNEYRLFIIHHSNSLHFHKYFSSFLQINALMRQVLISKINFYNSPHCYNFTQKHLLPLI
jgi:hypothetical protein